MSHITIIIDRAPSSGETFAVEAEASPVTARVTFVPPDAMSEAEVTQQVRRLYRQVRNLGTDNS